MRRRVVALCAVALLSAGAIAEAKPRAKRSPYALRLAPAWQRLPIDTSGRNPTLRTHVLEAYSHAKSGRTFVVTRTSFPNFDAKKHPAAYMNSLEVGLRALPGYKRLRRDRRTLRNVPVVDYVFRRRVGAGEQIVMMRFLLYRSWSYAATLTTPAKAWRTYRRRSARALKRFRPR